jgi:hypothetical protein
MKGGKGCRQEPPRVFYGGWSGRLLPAIVTASGILGMPVPDTVTGMFLVMRRLEFIAAA